MEPITVSYQVISSDFTRWDKAKRFGRTLAAKTQNFLATAKGKITDCKQALAQLFRNLSQYWKRCHNEVWETVRDIKNDWDNKMELLTKISDFLFGPPASEETENYTKFSTGNVAGSMMGAVVSQRGYVSEEQVEQFGQIAAESTANLKRLGEVLKHIKTVDGNETEMTKQVFKLMDSLDRNAHKRRQYEYDRRREHHLLAEKNQNLRRGIE